MGVASELLGDQVLGLAAGVGNAGGEEGEDLPLPPLDGPGQPCDFGDSARLGVRVELLQSDSSSTGCRSA